MLGSSREAVYLAMEFQGTVYPGGIVSVSDSREASGVVEAGTSECLEGVGAHGAPVSELSARSS